MAEKVQNVEDLENLSLASNRTTNFYISSQLPEVCKTEKCVLGIDEAGRGPVLGPMVYGISYCPKDLEKTLRDSGCADSKTLTEAKREEIFNDICSQNDKIGWEVEVISPTYISNCMLKRHKHSLNEISHDAAINLIKRALILGANITEVYVDTVGPAEKYQNKLKGIFPELDITVTSKADSIYPIVGAASICAKVTRDVCLRKWTFSEMPSETESLSWGSGYPNDPDTKKFLVKHMDQIFGFPDIVRFSWSTAEKILEENAITVEWEEDPAVLSNGTKSVKEFFHKTVDLTVKEKHRYFADRNLSSVSTF